METKDCWECEQSKPMNEFLRTRSGEAYPTCKECNAKQPNKKPGRKARPKKLCPDCKQLKPRKDYTKVPANKDGLNYCCKICAATRTRAYYDRRKTIIPITITEKRCSHCRIVKPVSDFSRNRASKDHLEGYCRLCVREINKTNNTYLLTNYGITWDDFYAMLAAQNNVCAICKEDEKVIHLGKKLRLSVDHNHKTKKVRGLLCYACNHLVGYLQRHKHNLVTALAYIEKHEIS